MIECSVCGWRHTVPCGRDECPHDSEAHRPRIVVDHEELENTLRAKLIEAEQRVTVLEAQLQEWRSWAQFVYLGGGPITIPDDDLRAGVNATHDRDVREVRAVLEAQIAQQEPWKEAALLKDRTRHAIRDRARAGESVEDLALDYGVPVPFVQILLDWQLFEDDPPVSSSSRGGQEDR